MNDVQMSLTNLASIVEHVIYDIPGGFGKIVSIAKEDHIRRAIPLPDSDDMIEIDPWISECEMQRDVAGAWWVAFAQESDVRELLSYPVFRTFDSENHTDDLNLHLDASEAVMLQLAEDAVWEDKEILNIQQTEYLFWHLKELFPEHRLFMLWPKPYEVYKDFEVISRIDGRSKQVSTEVAKVAKLLLEHRGEYVSLTGKEIAAPKREVVKLKSVFSSLPVELQPRIDHERGKGYRLMS